MTRPLVSVLVPTYGRVALLEEVIESFLRQDTDIQRELVVLNDNSSQYLEYNGPLPENAVVHVVNVSERFKSLGDKRNALVEAASGELIMFWDDDDIPLPDFISYQIRNKIGRASYSNKLLFWRYSDKPPQTLVSGRVWLVSLLTTRSTFLEYGGCDPISSGEDRQFMSKIRDIVVDLPGTLPYIYRWDTCRYHASGFGIVGEGISEVDVYNGIESAVSASLMRGAERAGVIELVPRWHLDYVKLSRDADSQVTIDVADYLLR